ncbi:MAG: hypothetical protein AAFN30_10520 [Actinomycetota bacterium]
MAGFHPRFPFRGLALIGLGVLLAMMIGGAGSAGGVVAGLLILPFLAMKLLFVFLLLGLVLRFVGPGGHRHRSRWVGHGGGWDGRRRRHGGRSSSDDGSVWRYQGRPMRPDPSPPAPGNEGSEWEESLRQARREVDDLDAPYRAADVDLGGDRPGD